jgi:chorismate mutase/prephenate dehydratase
MDEPDPSADRSLAALRAELDGIDDALHDLLMRRAAVVEHVAHSKAATGAGARLRPGREAAIIRRLLARHHGPLPPNTIVRIWRELLAGSIALQGGFTLCTTAALAAVAREQFGALTPQVILEPPQALAALRAGAAAIAVLPLPCSGDDAWWSGLAAPDSPRLHVIARLPVWRPRPQGAPTAQALVISTAPPDPSGDDRTLLAIRGTHALTPTAVLLGAAAPGGWSVIELAGLITETDPRLAAVANASVLGAYAAPAG